MNDSDEIPNESESRVVTSVKKFGNFQDSKEIMMTSDTEGQYKYTSTDQFRLTTSRSSVPCGEGYYFINLHICFNDFFSENSLDELRCVSGRCITSTQLCDKVLLILHTDYKQMIHSIQTHIHS